MPSLFPLAPLRGHGVRASRCVSTIAVTRQLHRANVISTATREKTAAKRLAIYSILLSLDEPLYPVAHLPRKRRRHLEKTTILRTNRRICPLSLFPASYHLGGRDWAGPRGRKPPSAPRRRTASPPTAEAAPGGNLLPAARPNTSAVAILAPPIRRRSRPPPSNRRQRRLWQRTS